MLISSAASIVLETTGPRWLRRMLGVCHAEINGDDLGRDSAIRLPGSAALFGAGGWPNIEQFDPLLMIELLEEEMGVTEAITVGRTDLAGEPLTVGERKARAAAVRGLVNARDGRFDKARALFTEALTHDPSLDLTQIPTFWKLPRGGQDAAVEAYHESGMIKEAKVLSSNLNYHFRPKLVRRRPRPVIVPSS
jgi:hypothetical protein